MCHFPASVKRQATAEGGDTIVFLYASIPIFRPINTYIERVRLGKQARNPTVILRGGMRQLQLLLIQRTSRSKRVATTRVAPYGVLVGSHGETAACRRGESCY